MPPEILNLDATELIAAFRNHELSPVEVLSAALDRAEATQNTLNAFAAFDRKGALEAAQASEKRWHRGTSVGAVDGVPISVKDNIYVESMPTRFGSCAVPDAAMQGPDSPSVARLREAGAIVFGKTTLPDYAHKIVTDSPLTGITRNPWNLDHSPGGSSGGAAAAVAAGIGPAAVATDGGGSIRIPAAWTGIYGLKPSFGRVPHHPRGAYPTISHIGPMTRSVRDAALMLTIMARPDGRDWYALPYEAADYVKDLARGIRGVRVAVSTDLGTGAPINPAMTECISAAFRIIEELGAHIEVAHPDEISLLANVHRVHWCTFSARLARTLGDRASKLDATMQALVAIGEALPPAAFVDAVVARGELGSKINGFFDGYDLVIAPVISFNAPAIAAIDPRSAPVPSLTSWANQTGLPAASVPCGITSAGLPIGLQIVGGPRSDGLVLQASYAIEQAVERRNPPRCPPNHCSYHHA